jgi:GTPase
VIRPDDGSTVWDQQERLTEACGLAEALGLDVVQSEVVALRRENPSTLLGQGRVEAIAETATEHGAKIVVIDAGLSPTQQRNLEKTLDRKVIDRTGLILEIFGLRARTREGRLQVELARLAYERTRLVRTWTHLERQRGGTGKTGGPGERQLEIDRRLIADRIARLQGELDEVRRTRGLQRRARERAGLPVVTLVGYTNAGKSTLFNRLTNAGVFVKDMPFATLDPTMRAITLPSGRKAILSDTVGFISDLPTELVAAFRATLEEVVEADLVLHVRDISHDETERQAQDVDAVLAQLFKEHAPPVREVWNKIDRLPSADTVPVGFRAGGRPEGRGLPVSALTGHGIDLLLEEIETGIHGADALVEVDLSPDEGQLRSWLFANARVIAEQADDGGRLTLQVRATPDILAKLGGRAIRQVGTPATAA